MEQKRGGGHGLTAHDNFFASRYGHNAEELFDERDDGSWVQVDDDDFEEDDGISRLGFDENTFASSFASNVHVRNTSSSIAGSLRTKKTTFHPSTKGPTTRPSQKILGVEKGAVTAKGGSCASYCTVHWLGTNSHGQSMRRVSHHIVFQSGDIMKSLKAARVSGDSKQFVLQMYRPKCLWDADIQCDWLHEEISSEYHMLPESQIETLFKMNPRRVGMARHAAKHFIPGEVPVDELRLDCAGIRVDPNFVTQFEDNVCNGASIWKEDDGTIRGNFELKELGKGSSESNRDIQWGINIGVMPAAFAFAGHVPSSISVGSKRNRGSSSKTTDDMEVDSSFHTYRGSAFDEEEEYFSPQNNGKKCDGHDQCFYDGFTGEEVVSECGSDMIEYALERAIANAECLYLEGKAEFEEQFGDGGGKPAAVPKKSPIQVETVASKDSDAYDGAPVASEP